MNDKIGLHPKNKHKSSYDFKKLIQSHPELSKFVTKNKFNNESINFSDPLAVKALNTALLKHFYDLSYWDIPKGHLCPPIPGRADYIHHVHDLVASVEKVRLLDIGVGANCIYPLIANKEYGWSVVGSDIEGKSLENAAKIVNTNDLQKSIELRTQKDKEKIFENIIFKDEFFDLSICNPPFHASAKEAQMAAMKKNQNLRIKTSNLNFGGKENELWCPGGEAAFIKKMIEESSVFQKNCGWFTTLVSKNTTLPALYAELKLYPIKGIRTIDMHQGQKKTRILAWSFLHK